MKNNFWNDSQSASNCLKKIAIIEKEIKSWADLKKVHDDLEILVEFAENGEIELRKNDDNFSSTQHGDEVFRNFINELNPEYLDNIKIIAIDLWDEYEDETIWFEDASSILNVLKWLGIAYLKYLAYDIYKSRTKYINTKDHQ